MNCDIINSTEAVTATADTSTNANDIINTVNTVNSNEVSDSIEKGHDHDHEQSKSNLNATTSCVIHSGNANNNGVTSLKATEKITNSNNKTMTLNKSWYARCSRWRSQSCDRKNKNSFLRYSWNNGHQQNHRTNIHST